MKLRTLLVIVITTALTIGSRTHDISGEQAPSLGEKIKRFFTGPTPTPHKKVRKKARPAPGKEKPERSRSPSESPSELPSETGSASSPGETMSPQLSAIATPESTSTGTPRAATRSSSARRTQTFEPVRPMSPPPRRKSRKQVPEETPSPPSKRVVTSKALSSVSPKKEGTASRMISSSEIAGYENYPAKVCQILDLGLSLATQNLGYKYNSADPANGGMDCSGFIHYVLSKSGVKDVPRDAHAQYAWVRKTGAFQTVPVQRNNTSTLDALKPGDLLFWGSSYSLSRDLEITQTMLYLGREKGTNQRIMVGASEGHTYKGQPRSGVSVVDLKLGRAHSKKTNEPRPAFVGYGPIPGLRAE